MVSARTPLAPEAKIRTSVHQTPQTASLTHVPFHNQQLIRTAPSPRGVQYRTMSKIGIDSGLFQLGRCRPLVLTATSSLTKLPSSWSVSPPPFLLA